VTLLQNLNSELTRPSLRYNKLESFNDNADREAFYVSIYPLLGNCLYAVRQSLLHLNMAVDYELEVVRLADVQYNPKTFYKSTSDQAKCMFRYTFVSSVLQILQTQLTFASKRVFSWLQENSGTSVGCASTPDSTAKPATEAMTTDSVTNSGVPIDSVLPGMANLLACGTTESQLQVINDWKNITSLLTTDIVNDITICLSEYQMALNSAYAAATTALPGLPQLSATSALTATLAQLDSDNAKFTLAANSYISGNMTKLNLGKILTALVQNMSVDIDIISPSVTVMINEWQTNLTLWTSNITALYTNVISTLNTLSVFLPADRDLIRGISDFRMWRKPSIQLQPALKIIYANDESDTRKSITRTVTAFLQNTAKSQVTLTLNNVLTFTTQQCQALSSQIKLRSSVWGSIKSPLSYLLTEYVSSLVLNDGFMR
jgi:hypothetical protein